WGVVAEPRRPLIELSPVSPEQVGNRRDARALQGFVEPQAANDVVLASQSWVAIPHGEVWRHDNVWLPRRDGRDPAIAPAPQVFEGCVLREQQQRDLGARPDLDSVSQGL